ncbi:HipA N-terminal domain-containing protein [Nocardia sienata]|uniref:HipA N-terminal domain-containing protein n=1 Tax=Nocardia sienata TaxID=248552 RepID=UPI0007A464CE|nr:HipA N-terminal domain-containing protein [Nocardia sienata]
MTASDRPIATTLPLTDAPIRTFGGSLPAYFAGLLPEGHRLSVLRRAVKTGLDDELTLLLAVGTDAPGDVQVIPHGEPLVEVPALVSGESPADLDFTALVEKVDPSCAAGCAAEGQYVHDQHAPRGRFRSVHPETVAGGTLIYDDDSMALPIGGRTRELKARDWIGFAAEIGLPDRGAASARAVALRAADAIDYGRLPFTGSPVRKVERELGFRRSELQRL